MFAILLAMKPSQTVNTDVTINATQSSLISPYIYGANFPDWANMNLPFTVARQGGNRMTAYNWENNASNAGNDYHFQNDGYLGATNQAGWTISNFLGPTQAHGAAAILTIPMAGYVSADKNPPGDVRLTKNYIKTRFKASFPNKPGGKYVYPPNAAGRAVYQDECVHWIESIASPATPVWFALDNEPDIWSGTHAEIHPHPTTYAELISKTIHYSTMIKRLAPQSLVFGPVSYGWEGYVSLQNAPDAQGRDFLDTYLSAMQTAQNNAGKRLLDVLDLHWYPEATGNGVRITSNSDNSPAVQEARIQAPRSLWDSSYVETSWITQSLGNKSIKLIPRIDQKIQTYYPGTKLAFTEYNYGGETDASGAVAQADVLGIFGRYGVFAACNWGIGDQSTSQLAAFRAFLNYNGHGSKVGDTELGVKGENPAQESVYAMLDSHHAGRMTLVLVNKVDTPNAMTIHLGSFHPASATGYLVDQTYLSQSGTVPVSILGSGNANEIQVSAPGYSVITVELDK